MKIKSNFPALVCPASQRGATLIVALIMLLLITLVGVAGMQQSTLQERMAGSTRDRALAMQAAEAALRTAEKLLKPPAAVPSTVISAVLVRKSADGTKAISEADYWKSKDNWAGATEDTTLGTANGLSESPKYVIEKMPDAYSKVPGSRNENPASTDPAVKWVRDYRITARATGASEDAVVILQSTYRVLE